MTLIIILKANEQTDRQTNGQNRIARARPNRVRCTLKTMKNRLKSRNDVISKNT